MAHANENLHWVESAEAEGRRRRRRIPEADATPDEAFELGRIAGYDEALEEIRAVRAQHPKCDIHYGGDPVKCGWKRTVLDIDAALGEVR